MSHSHSSVPVSVSAGGAAGHPVSSIFEIDFMNGKHPKEDGPRISSAFIQSLAVLKASEYHGDVALITGANKGLGLETARALGSKGLTVLLGSRDEKRGREAEQKLKELFPTGSFHFLLLDVGSEQSIAAAVDSVAKQFGRLDVLINNAGILDYAPPSAFDATQLRAVFETNVFGPMLLTKACLPLLHKSAHPRIVNVSSGLGSLDAHTPNATYFKFNASNYCTSKAALNMFTLLLANEMREKNAKLRINTIDPGYTATDLNGHSGPQTVEEGTIATVTAALLSADGPTGAFFNRYGYVAW